MALHPAIEKIERDPKNELMVTSGFDRSSSMFVTIKLKKAYWGLVDPEDLLSDDRLPATYSAWPPRPYPQTNSAGTLLVPYSVKDSLRTLQRVTLTSQDVFSSVNFRYEYESNPRIPAGALPAELRQNPAGSPAGGSLGYEIDYDYEEVEIPYTIDGQNLKVKISSGERPDPLPTRKLVVRVCNIMRLERYHRINFHDEYAYTINLEEWNGRAASTVCCFPIKYGKWQEIGGVLWWPVFYTFKWLARDNAPADLRPTISAVDFWRDVVLSMSLNQKGPDGKLQRIRLKEGPTSVPLGLDASGHYIDPPDSAAPHEQTFRKIAVKSFTGLSITLPPQESPP